MSTGPRPTGRWDDLPAPVREQLLRDGKPEGMSWYRLGVIHGVNESAVRRKLDPEWRALTDEKTNAYKRTYRMRHRKRLAEERKARAKGKMRPPNDHVDAFRPKPSDISARLAEIPNDTRSLTGRFFGDPIPNDPRRKHLKRIDAGLV